MEFWKNHDSRIDRHLPFPCPDGLAVVWVEFALALLALECPDGLAVVVDLAALAYNGKCMRKKSSFLKYLLWNLDQNQKEQKESEEGEDEGWGRRHLRN